MKKHFALLLAILASSPALPLTAETEVEAAPETLDVVLVTGEQPGPGLWKVSRDGHVMWVLGSIGGIPNTISVRTNEIKARVAESQEVLYPGWVGVGLDIGVFKALTLVPAAFRAAKNPDGATLKDVLTPETYARWRRLKQEFIGGDDDIERYRPMIAHEKLQTAIARKYDMGSSLVSIEWVVDETAKNHQVKINRLPGVERKMRIENLRALLKGARRLDLAEGECVGRHFEKLENAIAAGKLPFDKVAINAWATGDLETLRGDGEAAGALPEDCVVAALDAVAKLPPDQLPEGVGQGMDILRTLNELEASAVAENDRNWLSAAETALARNASTFAVLPMGMVLSPTGYLAQLQARGYEVEAPH